jgi:hypothetical protein
MLRVFVAREGVIAPIYMVVKFGIMMSMSWGSSVILASDCRLDTRCSIPGRGK